MTAGTRPVTPDLRAALDAARVVFGAFDRTPAPELWQAAQAVLQLVLARPELRGQALVGEARRAGRLSLPDAHALIELHALADRTAGPAATEAERIQVREAWMAVQHAVPAEAYEPPSAPNPWAPPPASARLAPPPPGTPTGPSAGPPSAATAPRADHHAPASAEPSLGHTPRSGRSFRPTRRVATIAAAAVLFGIVLGGAIWWVTVGRDARRYREAVAAYQRGAREAARSGFVELAQRHPDDARPLVYLGRLSREDADYARARRFLTTAVRLAPGSAVAQRELAAAMLADGQPELARRFYVNAIALDPTDRVAQGFLACALYRLQRYDEVPRWLARAGAGEWQRCVGPLPVPGLPPGLAPAAPVGPSPTPTFPR